MLYWRQDCMLYTYRNPEAAAAYWAFREAANSTSGSREEGAGPEGGWDGLPHGPLAFAQSPACLLHPVKPRTQTRQ